MQCAAVIVAAGRGERLGGSVRKALVPLGDRPLLAWSLGLFAACPEIAQIVLVVHADDLESFRSGEFRRLVRGQEPSTIVAGGSRRQDSVLAGCEAVRANIEGVLVHDAARPFASRELVARLARALDEHDAAVPVVPVTSTVKRVGATGRIETTVDRAPLRLAQTPQAARRAILLAALRRADREGREVTDDGQAIELGGGRVVAIDDSPTNFKITTHQDLELARLLVAQSTEKR